MELSARSMATIFAVVCLTWVWGLEDCNTHNCLEKICEEKETGYYAHPTHKNQFLHCKDGKVHIFNCSRPDLEWSDKLQTCNYASDSEACKEGEYLPHSTDSAKYIQCLNSGVGVIRQCGPGTIWDSAKNVCNHGNVVTCDLKDSNGSDSEPSACPQQANGIFPDPSDCTRYYVCEWGRPSATSPIQCHNGMLFDPNISNCNWATKELKDQYCS